MKGLFYLLFLLSIPVLIVLDQIIKYVIYNTVRVNGSIPILKDVFHISYTQNEGAAFGLLKNHRWVFITFTVIVIIYLLYLLISRKVKSRLFVAASCLIVAGGIGNLIDRVFRGYVIDYLDFRLIGFPLFNLADTVICIGTGLLCIYLIFFSGIEGQKDGEGLDTEDKGTESLDS